MPGNAPPYALDTFAFSLPALASCAGRAPLGGDRELALGVWMSARLAQALLPPISLSAIERTIRAEKAKHWITSLAMPNPARLAFFRTFDATATYAPQAANALAELALIVAGHLDAASQDEIAHLVARLRATQLLSTPAQSSPPPSQAPPPGDNTNSGYILGEHTP